MQANQTQSISRMVSILSTFFVNVILLVALQSNLQEPYNDKNFNKYNITGIM